MKILELRRGLIKCIDYSIQGVTAALDTNGHNWVCAEDMLIFMKNYGIDVTIRQVEKLV